MDTGFFGHTLIIKKVGHIHILNKFPSFYKFSNGCLSYHISCHDPRLIQCLIKNSDRCLEEIHTNVFLWRVDTMGTRQMGPKLKTLRNLFHKCYGLQSKQYYIKTCSDACVSCIDNLGILENKSKILDIKSLLSGINSKSPYTVWFGKIDQKTEKRIDDSWLT